MLKPREGRVKLLARARMRSGAGWSDVCVVNASTRGVGLQAANPPEPGHYVEIRRGANLLLIGRVIWTKGHRFGVNTRSPVWIDGILGDAEAMAPEAAAATERRSRVRLAERFGWSRYLARAMEFGFILLGGVCFAVLAAGLVGSAFARPLAVLSTALTRS